jgi:transcriptional regulator with XRE-family HTH domain
MSGSITITSSPTKNRILLAAMSVKGVAMIQQFGRKLRRLRQRAGLNQSELAQAIGLRDSSKGYISEIESGKKIPQSALILRIALYFNVTTDYLLRDDIEVID